MRPNIKLAYYILILCLIPLTTRGQSMDPGAPQTSTNRPKRILVLYAYNYSQPAQQRITAGLESARRIANLNPDDYLHEYLDISPPKNPEQYSLLRQLLLKKYAGQRFDLIITVFNDALTFILDEGKDLSPDSPCLALYAQERPNLERAGKKIVQSPLYFDVPGTLELALKLFPKTHKVFFVSGKSALDMAFEDKARTDFAPWQGKLEIEYTGNRSMDEVLERAADLSPGTIVIYARVSSDITGKIYSPNNVAVMLAKSSNAPVFSLATSQLDTGVVGGSMVDVEALSVMLGRTLASYEGKGPLTLEPASHFVRPMVNWEQVRRWNISAGRLPADTIILNRPPSLWNQYKMAVVTTLVIFLILFSFIIALAIQNRRRAIAETTARLSEARYRVLIDQAPDAIVVYDVDQNRFVDVNTKAEDLFGCGRDELLNSDLSRFFPPDQPDKQELAANIHEYLARPLTRAALPFERNILNASGSKTLCEVRLVRLPSEKRRLIRASFIDITERKRSEEALRQSEERYRSILWIAMDGFCLTDKDGRFLKVNDAYCRMSGYSEEELKTMYISDVEALEAQEQIAAHIEAIIHIGRVRFESRHRHKDGHLFDVEASVTYRDSDGGQFATFIRDITERKKSEEEREKLQAQLHQAQKMEYVGRLAGGVAHDFNNMLGVILGHLDMIMDEVDPAQPLFSELKEIRQAADRSTDLTRQLLAFARKQIVSPKVLDLNETVEGMLKMLRRLIGEDIDLAWLPETGLWPVMMDPGQVDQILANLCVNARDAIEGVGKITIETANATFDSEYCAKNLDCVPGNYVMIGLSDNGCGMDMETQDKIFEPYFTTKELGRGTGLGLSTIYGIVRQNSGFINVYSEPGKGTTFKIFLPYHPGKDEPMEEKSPEAILTRGGETILLAEDDAAILKVTTMMLERQGYTVLAASTPGEAIRMAEKHDGEIHLLVSDVIMPEMNGREVLKNISALWPNVKNLFMSGYTADVIARHGVLEEGVDFIQKPFSIMALAAKVREVLDRY
jgi:two-component system, cell cycle sensor histidine kinase and response regulator CckA